jgi:hypothetical protein
MQRPLWWQIVVVLLSALLASIVALRLRGLGARLTGAVFIGLLVLDGAALFVTANDVRLASTAYGTVIVANAAVIGVAWRRGQLEGQVMTTWVSLPFVICLMALVNAATRAHDAAWSAAADKGLFALGVASAFVACFVGKPTYVAMAQQERGGEPRSGSHLLAISLSSGFAAIVAFVPTVVFLGAPLGFDSPPSPTAPNPYLARPEVVAGGAAISLLAALLAWRSRPRTHKDDRLRLSPVASSLGALALAYVDAILIIELTRAEATIDVWWVPYWAVMALLIAMLYTEDAIATPVALHHLHPRWPAWTLAGLMGLTMAMATYWTATTRFWTPTGSRYGIAPTLAAIVTMALILVTVAACGYVLAFASDPAHQQLTAKAAWSNMLQGQGLYAGVTLMVLLVPTQVLTRLVGNWLEILSAIVAFGGFTFLVWRLFRFTAWQNAEHYSSETKRKIPQLAWRRADPAGAEDLRQTFLRELRRHTVWQERIGGSLLILAGVGAGLIVQIIKAHVETHATAAGPPRSPSGSPGQP